MSRGFEWPSLTPNEAAELDRMRAQLRMSTPRPDPAAKRPPAKRTRKPRPKKATPK